MILERSAPLGSMRPSEVFVSLVSFHLPLSESDVMQARNTRIGLILFAIYLFFYTGFVLINAVSPETMRTTPITGVNLAIVYGFSLILAAFVLAMLYGFLCHRTPSDTSSEATPDRKVTLEDEVQE